MTIDTTYGADYFKDRQLNDGMFYQMQKWLVFCMSMQLKNPSFLFAGCGLGHHVHVADYYGINAKGFDLEFPITNTPYKYLKDRLKIGDITNPEVLNLFDEKFDVVVIFDVLEHMNNIQEVETALELMKQYTKKYIIISVPVIGDSNLYLDSSHKIFKTKEWWCYKIVNSGFKIIETPLYFPYRNQIFLGEK